MEVLFPQLEELWDLLEVPESEQAQVHHWLGALAMTTPVDVSRARQMDIVHWEVQRLASYIPLLELVAQRQVLLEELAQHQDEEDENSKDHVVLLGKELSTLQCDLVERITQNEKYYRKPLTFRGERVMDLIMSVKG